VNNDVTAFIAMKGDGIIELIIEQKTDIGAWRVYIRGLASASLIIMRKRFITSCK